jgi:predicted nucleic acid-binding protein
VALSRYCLDTSAYSQFKRGHPRAVELIDGAEWLGLPSIVLGELWLGFLSGRQVERNTAELEEFLGNPAVHPLAIDADVARIFADIMMALRRAGTPLPTNDVWIAAAAANVGATVMTYDGHFKAIERVGSLVLEA